MAIITFSSNEIKETGQTLSLAAIVTHMSIEHNYKTLVISTSFKDSTLEDCFWENGKQGIVLDLDEKQKKVGVESGIEGLLKIMSSNKTTPEIVRNYSRIVLRDRLDVLESPSTEDYQEYSDMAARYVDIIQVANKYYDMVFVELSPRLPKECYDSILQISNIVMVNLTQKLRSINNFVELRESNDFYKRNNIILLIGRYDKFSKYTSKNITRYLREKKEVSCIPYNTLYMEACSEGKIIDLLLKLKNVKDESDRNHIFMKEIEKTVNGIIFKLQELQMKM